MTSFEKNNEDCKCAPSKKYDTSAQTCFTLDQLKSIAVAYNKSNKDAITFPPNMPDRDLKKYLLRQLLSKLSGDCKDSQVCLLYESFVENMDDFDIMYNTFRPRGPVKKHEWLSTLHINSVLIQYTESFKDFLMFGSLPIDFKEIKVPISYDNFFERLSKWHAKGIHRLGWVFNLDRHDQPGSHWVSLFADIHNNQVYFFDSAENHQKHKPNKNILELMKTIAIWCYYNNFKKSPPHNKDCDLQWFGSSKNFIEKVVDVRYNTVQHQYGNSECGVYSINFIVSMLNDNNFDKYVNNPISDKAMNEFRKKYFRFK